MNQLDHMNTFIHVVESASFTKAAEQLGLPKASVSERVARLESLMGTRLLHRTTRRVQLTQDGQVLYERCKDLLAEAADIETMFQREPTEINGRLRVDMPVIIARDVVIPQLSAFMALHPNIEIELSCTDRIVDVIGEGFDCVVRVGVLADSSLVARRLGEMTMVNCVSAGYAKTHGVPLTLDDLSEHAVVHYAAAFGTRKPSFDWSDAGQMRHIKMRSNITVNNSDAYFAACMAGFGIVQTALVGVAPLLQQGTWLEILPTYREANMPISLLYPHRRHLSRRVQAFMNWMENIVQNYCATER